MENNGGNSLVVPMLFLPQKLIICNNCKRLPSPWVFELLQFHDVSLSIYCCNCISLSLSRPPNKSELVYEYVRTRIYLAGPVYFVISLLWAKPWWVWCNLSLFITRYPLSYVIYILHPFWHSACMFSTNASIHTLGVSDICERVS